MHLYAITRGIKPDVDRYINELLSKYFPYPIKGISGEQTAMVQLAVRPIQLWEFVFPKEVLPMAVGTICNESLTCGDFRDKFLNGIRLMLKAKKLPKWDYAKLPKLPIYKPNVAVYPIGWKGDKNWPGPEML